MPRIPLSLPQVAPNPVFTGEGFKEQVEAEGAARLASSLAELSEQLAVDRARAQVSEATTQLRNEITDELEAIDRDPNRIDGIAQGLDKRFAGRADELMAGIAHPEAKFEFRDRAEGMRRQARASAFRLELERLGVRATAQLNNSIAAIGRELVAVGTPVALEKAKVEIDQEVTLFAAAGHADVETANRLVREHQRGIERALILDRIGRQQFGLLHAELEAGLYGELEAEELARFTAAALQGLTARNAEAIERVILDGASPSKASLNALVDRPPEEGGITLAQRNVLAGAAERRRNQLEVEGREARRLAQEESADFWLTRLYPEPFQLVAPDGTILDAFPTRAQAERARRERERKIPGLSIRESRAGLPTASSILADPVLPPAAKEHFIGLLEKRSRGEDLNATHEALANELYARIHDPTHPKRITSFAEIVPSIGNGLSREEAERMRADIDAQGQLPDPLAAYLRQAEKQIVARSPLGFVSDPQAPARFWAFRVEVQRRWDAELAAGRDPLRLLDPGADEFVGKILGRYLGDPSPAGQIESLRRILEPQQGESAEREPEVPPRLPGETVQQYRVRTRQR